MPFLMNIQKVMTILVYSDSEIIDKEWLPTIQFPEPIEICHDFVEYARRDDATKIAFTTYRLHCDHDLNCPAYVGFEDKIVKLSETSKLVFTFESELHHYHWEMWEKCHRDNVYWVVPGQVNDDVDMNNHIIYWGDWFKTTANLYKQLPQVTEQYTPYANKPRFFDALLGSPKPHRDFVSEHVKSNGLEDKFIMTYGGQWDDNSFYAKDYFIYEPNTEIIEKDAPGTCGYVKYHDILTHLSQVIPMSVFNDTAYSIVAETDFDNTLSFYSEKTAKPIIYKRLFVAFTGYKFLHNLRSFGFRTFDGIIDESYDLIEDDTQRLQAAFEQVKYLCNTPQEAIHPLIADILEHNYRVMMDTDWTRYASSRIGNVINGLQS